MICALLLFAGLVPLGAAGFGTQPPKKKLEPEPVVMATRQSFQAHKEGVSSLTFSPDGKVLATTGSPDPGAVKLWDAKTGKELASFKPHKERTDMVAFSSDGKTFATTGQDHQPRMSIWGLFTGVDEKALRKSAKFAVRVWVVPTGDAKEVKKAAEHAGEVGWFGFLPDGTLVRIGDRENALTIVTFPDGKELFRGEEAPDKVIVHDISLTRDLACVCVEATKNRGRSRLQLVTWQPATGRRQVHEVPWIEGRIYGGLPAFAVSPDGRYVAVGYGTDMTEFWSDENRKRREAWGWRMLATRMFMKETEEGHVRVWDVVAGNERFMTLGHFARVEELDFSPDGRYLASRDELNMAKVWDVARGKPLNRLHGRITTMAFTPDGKNLVTGDEKGWVQFWEFVE